MENRNDLKQFLNLPTLGADEKKKRQELLEYAQNKFKGHLITEEMLELLNTISNASTNEQRIKIIIEKEKTIFDELQSMTAKPPTPNAPGNNFHWMNIRRKQSSKSKYEDVVCYNITNIVTEKFGEPKDHIYLITTNNRDESTLNNYWKNILARTANTSEDDYMRYMVHPKNTPYIIITEKQFQKLADQSTSIRRLWEKKQGINSDLRNEIATHNRLNDICEKISKVEKKYYVPQEVIQSKNPEETEKKEALKKRKAIGNLSSSKLPKTNPIFPPITVPAPNPIVGEPFTVVTAVTESDSVLLAEFTTSVGSNPTLFGANSATSNPPQATQSAPQEARTSSQVRKS